MEKATQVAADGRKRKAQIQESESEFELELELELELSTSSVQLKTRRLSPDDSDSSTCGTDAPDHVSASCSSSNRSGELAAKASSQFVDLEENHVEFSAISSGDSLDCTEDEDEEEDRRETTTMAAAESGELESTAMPESRLRTTTTTTDKMPSEAELDEFFTAAEKNIQEKFIDRYNYDIVKDQPLEGRYEWVQIQLNP